MKKLWILIIILMSLFVLGFILRAIIQSSSDVNSIRKFSTDLKILQVKTINYEDVNVTIKVISYKEEIKGIKFVFYDEENTEISIYQLTIEELKNTSFKSTFYVENTSRINKVTISPIFLSESGEELIGNIQDIYKLEYKTVFSPPKDDTGYSRETIINCEYASDCKDNNPCTVGSCQDGLCSYPLIPNCEFCRIDEECEDNNSCTNNSCLDKKCFYTLIEKCESCNLSSQCEDDDPCTENECIKKKCSYTPIINCSFCYSKTDCEDNNSCTENLCYNNECSYLTIPGCVSCSTSKECGLNEICMNWRCTLSQPTVTIPENTTNSTN